MCYAFFTEDEDMTINISLTPEAETKLRQRAASLGQDLSIVASDLLEEAVRRPSVDELLAPARKQVAESGMSDQAVDSFFRDVLKEVRDEKRAKQK
jgi:pantoate kinase